MGPIAHKLCEGGGGGGGGGRDGCIYIAMHFKVIFLELVC